MAEPIFLLLAAPGGWRAVRGAGESSDIFNVEFGATLEALADEVAAKAADVLSRKGYRGQGIILAIPSSWCFSASIQTSDLPRNDRKAMVYRLEEKLPIAAEAVVADFVVRQGGEALGVCAKFEPIRALIDALEGRGVAVQSVAPAALLAAQGMLPRSSEHAGIVLMADPMFGEGQMEILHLEAGQLIHWATAPADPADVQLHLDMASMTLAAAPRIETCGIGEEITGGLRKYSTAVTDHKQDLIASALAAGQRILGARERGWVELRRGPLAVGDRLRLYRRPLNAALAAGVVLMLGLSVAMLLRAHRYASAEAAANQQVVDAFREQFPAWDVPANVRAVIESEHRKAALAGGSTGLASGTRGRSAVETFKSVLGQLPTEGKLSIRKMSFEETSFDLEGQVTSYEQLDGIAAAARKAGMDVAAPESRKNAEGLWEFTLHGAVPAGRGAGGAGEVAKGGGE